MSDSKSSWSFHWQPSHILPTASQLKQLCEILRADIFPPRAVTSSLQAFLDQSPPELAHYDTEILNLEMRLAGLKSDRSSIEFYRDGCKNVFAPVRRLPTELLVEIFDLCAPPGADEISESTTMVEEMDRIGKRHLFQISKVCSRWYRIVMNTPRLWSTLVIDTHAWGHYSFSSKLVALAASSLERSGGAPLNLQIALEPNYPSERLVLDLLLKHCHRWKTVYLWVHPAALQAIASVKGNLPLLEDLSVNSATNSDRPSIDAFQIAPRLKTAGIAGFPSHVPTLPWQQLSHFSYENNGLSDQIWLSMLPFLPAHASCEVTLHPVEVTTPLRLTPISSVLSTLDLKLPNAWVPAKTSALLGDVLGCLTLPDLLDLRVNHDGGPPPRWNRTQFSEFASRSSLGNTLRSLELSTMIEEDELLECLADLSSLSALYLWDNWDHACTLITDTLLKRLTFTPGQLNLVPHLNFTAFNSTMRFGDIPFWDFVISRIETGRSPLGPLSVNVGYLPHCARELQIDVLTRASELQRRGDLHFSAAVEA
ncbi:hypothetical protein C8F04DRAFT_1123986, partial [Mycena alexandri]